MGSIEVTALLDGYINIKSELFIGLVDAEAGRLAEASFNKPGPRRTPVNAYLVNLGDQLVLIDAGMSYGSGPALGHLPAALQAAGVAPDQVDTLLITHMHPDHINGVLTSAGESLFPNAELVVTAADYAFWHDEANMNQAPDEAKPFFIGARKAAAAYADRLRQVDSFETFILGVANGSNAPKVGRFGDIQISLKPDIPRPPGRSEEVPAQSSAGLPPQRDNWQWSADVREALSKQNRRMIHPAAVFSFLTP